MIKDFILGSFLFAHLLPTNVQAQKEKMELTLEQSVEMLHRENQELKIATKEVEWARNEHQRLQAFWYPALNASGAYVHLSNKIEVKEPLNQFTDPAKEFVHSIIPDDQLITSILDKIGTYSLTFPLMPQNLTSIEANLTWPIFTGGKRIFAGKIGKAIVSMAETNRKQTDATLQTILVESYFGLRLGQKVLQVRQETFDDLQKHYQNALKLEANGIINKAERLFAQVNMDEAKRELESARKELSVAQNALKSIIQLRSEAEIIPTSPLFINSNLPSILYFKSLIGGNNYLINSLQQQEHIASNQLKISRSAYTPEIALFGKQTLYSNGIPSNLLPRTMIGVGFTWNLFDGLDREKRIRQAKITTQTVTLEKEKAMTDLEVGIDKFYSQMQNALDNVSSLNATIELSDELVRMRKKMFQEGMATSTEVIDAETMRSKVQIAFLLAYYQYDVALIHLLSICGTPEAFYQYSREGLTEQYTFAQKQTN